MCARFESSNNTLDNNGLFIFALAGPPCGDFSRAKLRPGGPKPLRTPEFPFGVPGLADRDQRRVASSRTLLRRVVQILLAVFGTGGHVCLEQPSSAFSWQDPSVQDFLAETAAVCSVVPACCFGLSIHKKWLFASSLQDMSQLAGECNRASWECQLSQKGSGGCCFGSAQNMRVLKRTCALVTLTVDE